MIGSHPDGIIPSSTNELQLLFLIPVHPIPPLSLMITLLQKQQIKFSNFKDLSWLVWLTNLRLILKNDNWFKANDIKGYWCIVWFPPLRQHQAKPMILILIIISLSFALWEQWSDYHDYLSSVLVNNNNINNNNYYCRFNITGCRRECLESGGWYYNQRRCSRTCKILCLGFICWNL